MPSKRNKPGAQPTRPKYKDGPIKWLLGALGVLSAGGMALRAFRRETPNLAEADEPYAAPGEVNRLAAFSASSVRALPHPIRGHESRDANAKWILWVVVFLVIFGLSLHGILAWFLSMLNHSPAPTDRWRPVERAGSVAPARAPIPPLQISTSLDLEAFQSSEDAELNSYGWINRTSGVVRIPIERAMEVVLREGLPTRSGTNGNKTGPSTYELMQRRPEHRQPEIQGEK